MKNDNVAISIVVPCYNHARFLERTLQSILRQNDPHTQIVVIDGGSTDGSLEIIGQYAPHLHYWISEKDRGQSDALNKGFAHANGAIFGWQNSDDYYEQGAFAQVREAFARHPEKTVVYGNWYAVDENDDVIEPRYALPVPTPHAVYENMDVYNQALFWKREAHERFGGFDVRLHRMMDNDLILSLIRNEGGERFLAIDAFLGALRLHKGQKTPSGALGADHFIEEKYLETKYGFPPRTSFSGFYYRCRYRWCQFYYNVKYGGLRYALRKLRRGFAERHGLL